MPWSLLLSEWEQWLESSKPAPQLGARGHGYLAMARKTKDSLELVIQKPVFQLDDPNENALFESEGGGPSVIEPGTPLTKLEVPLSDLLQL